MNSILLPDVGHTDHLCGFTVQELYLYATEGFYALPRRLRNAGPLLDICVWTPQTYPLPMARFGECAGCHSEGMHLGKTRLCVFCEKDLEETRDDTL